MNDDDIPFPVDESRIAEYSQDIKDAKSLGQEGVEMLNKGWNVKPEKPPDNRKKHPPYYSIVKAVNQYDHARHPCKESIVKDLLTHIAEMTAAESGIYLAVHHSMDHNTNLGKCERPKNASQNNAFSRAYAKLKRKEVLRRVRNDVYMINPMLVIPANWDASTQLWRELK